ncbi:MAG: HEAT repeat domain-containing protein [Caldilineales bacterium]
MSESYDTTNERYSNASPEDIQALIETLGADDGLKREQARFQLVFTGRAATMSLIDALSDPSVHRRWEAAKALGAISDPRAAAPLVEALDDENASVRWVASDDLITMGRDGLEPLLRALIADSGSVWLREGAHHVLHFMARNGMAELTPVVDALEDIVPTIEVPVAAYYALQTLNDRHPAATRTAVASSRENRLV